MPRLLGLATIALLITSAPTVTRAAFITYTATLGGGAVTPATASPGTGSVILGYDPILHTLRFQVTFRDLLGPAVNAVIHGPTAVPGIGKAGNITPPILPGFPFGGASGSYDQTFSTLSDSLYGPAFESSNGGTAAGAEAALLDALNSGRAYFDIHTTTTSNIEVAGFLSPAAVPEPSSLALAALGLGLAAARRAACGRSRLLARSPAGP